MNNTLKLGLLVAAIGVALPMGSADAAVVQHTFRSNAVNYCQAFTPGPSNTIRNRVVGAENVGASPIAVACNFHSMTNGTGTSPTGVEMWFSNNSAAPIQITCTLLTGWQGQGGTNQYTVTKTTGMIPGGGTVQDFLFWGVADNPNAGATTLGSNLIGINCTLPTGGVLNDSYLNWNQDNGV